MYQNYEVLFHYCSHFLIQILIINVIINYVIKNIKFNNTDPCNYYITYIGKWLGACSNFKNAFVSARKQIKII